MDRLILTLTLVFTSTSVAAASFEARVDKANAVFESEAGEAYEKKLGPYIHAAIKSCASVGSTSRENQGKFVLVGDVSSRGEIADPAVRPETEASICFRREFASQTLPVPPDAILSGGFAPLVVEIYIVP